MKDRTRAITWAILYSITILIWYGMYKLVT